MNLQEYIKYVKESCLNEGIVPTPDMILDVSCRLLISNNISQNKKENIQAIKNSQPCLQAKRADAKSNQGKQNSEKNSTSFSNNGKVTYNSPSTSPEEYLSNKQIYFFKSRHLEIPNSFEEAVETISQIKEAESKKW